MREFIKTHRVLFLLMGVYAVYAGAATLKTWSAGEAISSNDLNNNFAIVSNRSLSAKAAATAATVSLSGFSTGPQSIKAYGVASTGFTHCTVDPCTLDNGYGITSIGRTSAGNYQVNLTGSYLNPKIALVTSADSSRLCVPVETFGGPATNTLLIICYNNNASPPTVQTDAMFSVVLMGQ
jgi:hypothetical protein